MRVAPGAGPCFGLKKDRLHLVRARPCSRRLPRLLTRRNAKRMEGFFWPDNQWPEMVRRLTGVLFGHFEQKGYRAVLVKRRCEGRYLCHNVRYAKSGYLRSNGVRWAVFEEHHVGHGERASWRESTTPDAQGKVRDLYDLGDRLLLVAPTASRPSTTFWKTRSPYKGQVLTQSVLVRSARRRRGEPPHLHRRGRPALRSSSPTPTICAVASCSEEGRHVPAECRARVSGWQRPEGVQPRGHVCGIELPQGLVNSSKLPEPIFTPSTKAEIGDHENISFERLTEILGEEDATALRDLALKMYTTAADHAAERGVIIADTKFEFGRLGDTIILADEVLTPTPRASGPAIPTRRARTSPASTSVRPRLADGPLGQDREPAAPSPGDHRRHVREVHSGRDHHRKKFDPATF